MTNSAPLAEISTYHELRDALKARATELGLSRQTLDLLSRLPDGYSAKLLGSNTNRLFGIKSLGALLRTLGLRIQLVPDEIALAKTLRLMGRRRSEPQALDGTKHWRASGRPPVQPEPEYVPPPDSIVGRLHIALKNIEAIMADVEPEPPRLTVIPGGKVDERANA